ncbi:hypothetical protein ACODT3_37020 [Streptomyces sp. 4.24]
MRIGNPAGVSLSQAASGWGRGSGTYVDRSGFSGTTFPGAAPVNLGCCWDCFEPITDTEAARAHAEGHIDAVPTACQHRALLVVSVLRRELPYDALPVYGDVHGRALARLAEQAELADVVPASRRRKRRTPARAVA